MKHLIKEMWNPCVVRRHEEYCREGLSVSWSGVGYSYVTGPLTEKIKFPFQLNMHRLFSSYLSQFLFFTPRRLFEKVSSTLLISRLYLPFFYPFPSPPLFTCTIFSLMSPHLLPHHYTHSHSIPPLLPLIYFHSPCQLPSFWFPFLFPENILVGRHR